MARSITLVGVDGVEVGPLRIGEGPALWGAAPVEYNVIDLSSGYRIGEFRDGPRDLVLPVIVAGDTPAEFETTFRSLIRATNPHEGEVRVIVTSADGTARELPAATVGGRDAITMPAPDTSILTVPLRLLSTYNWRSLVENEHRFAWDDFETQTTGLSWDPPPPLPWDPPPPLPWSGVSLRGYLDATLEAGGDSASWPVFRITGPAALVEAVNQRTGKRWQFDGALEEGQVLVVDTTPGREMLTVDEIPAFSSMGDAWDWWELRPGENPVHVWIENFGVTTSLEVTYYGEWITP